MKNFAKRLLFKISPSIAIMLSNCITLASSYGQYKSIKTSMAVDASGAPIPWYTYPAIEYLNSFDFRDCDIFEFGSGNSSAYWALRSRSVVSVEDNKDWFEIVKKRLRPNQNLIYRGEEREYISALAEQGRQFDVIVLDGNHRLQCTAEALKVISADGIILLDNSDRLAEKECAKMLRNQGYIQIDFSGFGPINGYCWSTSIFLKSPKIYSTKFFGPNPINGIKN